ncbi:MAG TPA: TIGR02530 family flagellar biosynthesis protein [Candidatus Elarobacter sp.]|nr:TIGR02530 family flagellar biosynthesis protein [Candidatus Elarobacter sp.]HEV2738585.1 TIGR02530 family flagellar biosynthesis protein [Candidatus Elarobacter sp.]
MADPKISGVQIPPAITPAVRPRGVPVQIPPAGTGSFRDVLRTAQPPATAPAPVTQQLKFSAHAQQRLESRNIRLTQDDVAKMNAMADKAAAKGSKQSLFMMRDTAMVVSITNRTVITAVDQSSMKENVFTNIDSAAIID